MQSTRFTTWVSFSLVAFGISVVLTWLVVQNFTSALFAGIVTAMTTYIGIGINNKQRIQEERTLRHSLRNHIQQLEYEEDQLYHSLYEATSTKEQLEASILALQGECHQLLQRISELHAQRNLLCQDIALIQKQQQQKEVPLQQAQQQVQLLEKKQMQIKHSLELKTTQMQQTEMKLNAVMQELENVQFELFEKIKQEEGVAKNTEILIREKELLEQQVRELQTRMNSEEIIQSSSENSSALNNTQKIAVDLPQEWVEWFEFIEYLSEEERIVFRAILEQDEASLKNVADRQTTMPEVLIEALNNNALQAFGDTIFSGGESSTIPEVHQEYLNVLSKPLKLEFKDFLLLPVSEDQSSQMPEKS